MAIAATTTRRRASRLPLAAFLLALVLTATTVLVAVLFAPIDDQFIEAADNAGWDARLLLPHQLLLSLTIRGAVLLSVVLTVVTFVAGLRSRRAGD
jgi:hypothetical protein